MRQSYEDECINIAVKENNFLLSKTDLSTMNASKLFSVIGRVKKMFRRLRADLYGVLSSHRISYEVSEVSKCQLSSR